MMMLGDLDLRRSWLVGKLGNVTGLDWLLKWSRLVGLIPKVHETITSY
jgi:hypothetical protein